MTSYALVVWAYEQTGSALSTRAGSPSVPIPPMLCSIFAGALSDRWDKRRTMLACDALAATTALLVLVLFASGRLALWHLYLINALNSLANTVQQPASDVAVSLSPRPGSDTSGWAACAPLQTRLFPSWRPVFATALFGPGRPYRCDRV